VITFTAMWAGGVPPAEQHKGRLVELGIADRYPFPAFISSLIYTTADPAEIPTLTYSGLIRIKILDRLYSPPQRQRPHSLHDRQHQIASNNHKILGESYGRAAPYTRAIVTYQT